MEKQSVSLTKSGERWIWPWDQSDNSAIVLPKSKTKRLSLVAQLANKEAEKSIERAYRAELLRANAITDAMFKSGKALRFSVMSAFRQIFLRTQAARRQFESRFR